MGCAAGPSASGLRARSDARPHAVPEVRGAQRADERGEHQLPGRCRVERQRRARGDEVGLGALDAEVGLVVAIETTFDVAIVELREANLVAVADVARAPAEERRARLA